MKFHKQLFRHDPENGIWGDCWRTAMACLLNLEPAQVPHFFEGGVSVEQFRKHTDEWLASQGYRLFEIAFQTDLDTVLHYMKVVNPGVYYLLSGTSPRDTTHVVIGLDNKIIHDPAIDGGDLVGPCSEDGHYWLSVLLPINVHMAVAA